MKSKTMRNISRVDQEEKHQHGYLVRVTRDGEMHQKFFSDSAHGGKRAALRAAKEHRDELLEQHPPAERGSMFDRRTSRNTSGHAGVSRVRSKRKGQYYDAWQASWVLPSGRRVARKFNFSPTGRSERAAKRLAIKARRDAIAAMENS